MKNLFVLRPVSFRIVFWFSSAMFSCSGGLSSDSNVKHINGLKIQASLIPADRHGENITVLLAISSDETVSTIQDIAWKGVSGYDEYKERMHYLNFKIQEDVSLSIGERKFEPVLSHLETGHELKHSRNILFVFSPDKPEDIEVFRTERLLDFRFEDMVFGTGISHFSLMRSDF